MIENYAKFFIISASLPFESSSKMKNRSPTLSCLLRYMFSCPGITKLPYHLLVMYTFKDPLLPGTPCLLSSMLISVICYNYLFGDGGCDYIRQQI